MAKTSNYNRIVKLLKDNPGSTIVKWYSTKGSWIYRLRDARVNPLINITESEFKDLYSSDIIKKQDSLWVLNN